MTLEPQEFDTALIFSEEIIKEAGGVLLSLLGKVNVASKGLFDIVSSADTTVEQFIIERIRREFPKHQIIAEESISSGTHTIDELCWVIDPLDGTVNFSTSIPFFSVSLALLYKGDPILGFVYDPIHKELFQAQKGRGSSLNGRKLVVETDNSLGLPIGGSSGFLNWGMAVGSTSLLQSLIDRFGKIRIFGSQALHLCYVAAGRLQSAISWEARLWDDAAGSLIATEAAVNYTDFWGQDIFPVRTGSPVLAGEPVHSVAAPPAIHGEIIPLLTGVCADEGDIEK